MNNKQKKFVKAKAQTEKAIFQVGKNNLSEETVHQIDHALEKRELVKISVLNNASINAKEAGETLADALHTEFMYTIGHTVVLYRPSSEEENQALSSQVNKKG